MALVDTVRDKWDNITPRERKMVVLLGISSAVIVVLFLAFAISDGLDSLEARNQKMRKALVVLADLKARGANKPTDDPTALIGTTPLSLPSYLDPIADRAGFKIPQTTPRQPVTKGEFTIDAVYIEPRDLTINQVKDLLEGIESNKVVQITSLTVTRNFRDKDKLDLRLEVETYSRVAKEGAAGAAETAPAAGQGK